LSRVAVGVPLVTFVTDAQVAAALPKWIGFPLPA